MYKQKEMSKAWIIFPVLTFIYQMLPITLPTDIDNFLMLGGSSSTLVLQFLVWKRKSHSPMLQAQTGEAQVIEQSNPPFIVCDEQGVQEHESSTSFTSEKIDPLLGDKESSLQDDLKILAPQVKNTILRNRTEIIRLMKQGCNLVATKIRGSRESREQGNITKQ